MYSWPLEAARIYRGIYSRKTVDGSSYMVVGQKRRVKWHGSKCQGELLAFACKYKVYISASVSF